MIERHVLAQPTKNLTNLLLLIRVVLKYCITRFNYEDFCQYIIHLD